MELLPYPAGGLFNVYYCRSWGGRLVPLRCTLFRLFLRWHRARWHRSCRRALSPPRPLTPSTLASQPSSRWVFSWIETKVGTVELKHKLVVKKCFEIAHVYINYYLWIMFTCIIIPPDEQLLWEPKVDDLELHASIEQHIFGLEIALADSCLMNVAHTRHELFAEKPDLQDRQEWTADQEGVKVWRHVELHQDRVYACPRQRHETSQRCHDLAPYSRS